MRWRCTWCGRIYDSEERPDSCGTCGRESFEGIDDKEAAVDDTVDTGEEFVWVCPNCGREHVKNNPPCSRCLNPSLEKQRPDYRDLERDLDAPSWLEVAKPYSPVILILLVVVALFATGIVPLSVIPGIGADVPGSADESDGIDHATVEAEIHDRLEDHRADIGESARTHDDGLAAFAEAYNQMLVTRTYTDDTPHEPDPGDYDPACTDPIQVAPLEDFDGTIDDYETPDSLAADLTGALLESPFATTLETGYETEGLDLHVGPDGELYVLYAAC